MTEENNQPPEPKIIEKALPFEEQAAYYDAWFDRHDALFQAELDAVRQVLAPVQIATGLPGLEVGVGSGRFAAALGVANGIEPAPSMTALARLRGIQVTEGVGEELPYPDASFGYTLFCTSLCFMADPPRALAEAHRVTVSGGAIIIAYLNPETDAGRQLLATKDSTSFYADATFRSTTQIVSLLSDAGYKNPDEYRQVVGVEPIVRVGADQGLFCVLRAWKGTAIRSV